MTLFPFQLIDSPAPPSSMHLFMQLRCLLIR